MLHFTQSLPLDYNTSVTCIVIFLFLCILILVLFYGVILFKYYISQYGICKKVMNTCCQFQSISI